MQVIDEESGEATEFRGRARAWLEAHGRRRQTRSSNGEGAEQAALLSFEDARELRRALHDARLAGITWPVAYGGLGLTNAEQRVFDEEAAAYDLGTAYFQIGVGMCGPSILGHGTESQRRRFIPPLLRGDEVWCQLFSEPGAGSDIASLQTRAERDGDEWVLTGQKVWTSGAQHSDFGIVLARTDPNVPKHRGLTMFILDMHAPGVAVRPLRQMSGESHFNEVFLDGVHIPADRVLGDLSDGWRVAITTMMNERLAVSGSDTTGRGVGAVALIQLARATGRASEPLLRQALADIWIRERLNGLLRRRLRAATRQGHAPGPEGSLSKLASAMLSIRAGSLAVAIAGPSAVAWDSADERAGRWSRRFNAAPGASIGGGTNEVLRNIIGERVLGLPKEPQIDRDLPFRSLLVGTQRSPVG